MWECGAPSRPAFQPAAAGPPGAAPAPGWPWQQHMPPAHPHSSRQFFVCLSDEAFSALHDMVETHGCVGICLSRCRQGSQSPGKLLALAVYRAPDQLAGPVLHRYAEDCLQSLLEEFAKMVILTQVKVRTSFILTDTCTRSHAVLLASNSDNASCARMATLVLVHHWGQRSRSFLPNVASSQGRHRVAVHMFFEMPELMKEEERSVLIMFVIVAD